MVVAARWELCGTAQCDSGAHRACVELSMSLLDQLILDQPIMLRIMVDFAGTEVTGRAAQALQLSARAMGRESMRQNVFA